ncbi:InlB B-repeat-containing protein [Ruminococcaceae bacterium OttesenSCG-928-A16]|nr:InlB B-repeat-containing protein [Ruminococcaceae bacterium OttesenSCG-928-A16]
MKQNKKSLKRALVLLLVAVLSLSLLPSAFAAGEAMNESRQAASLVASLPAQETGEEPSGQQPPASESLPVQQVDIFEPRHQPLGMEPQLEDAFAVQQTAALDEVPEGMLAPLAAAEPTFQWEIPDNGGYANDLTTAELQTDNWTGILFFSYPVPEGGDDVAPGALVATIDMGAAFTGELSLQSGGLFEISSLGSGKWQLTNTAALTTGFNADVGIKATLDGKIRALATDTNGIISFADIKMNYTDPLTEAPQSFALTLNVVTKKDNFTISKTAQPIDLTANIGLANAADLLTYNFVDYRIVVGQNLYTREIYEYVLSDAVPAIGAGQGAIVSVARGTTFLFSEVNGTTAEGTAAFGAGNNLATGNLVINAPSGSGLGNSVTYSVVVKYPKATNSVTNIANINGRYDGNASSELLGTSQVTIDTGDGRFAVDGSKAYSISKALRSNFQTYMGRSGVVPSNKFGQKQGEINEQIVAEIVARKTLPGDPANGTNAAVDMIIYDDVLTFNNGASTTGRLLTGAELYIENINVTAFGGATGVQSADVYLKQNAADAWPAAPTYTLTVPADSTNISQAVPADSRYGYAKIVYKNVHDTGSATIKLTYSASEAFTDEERTAAESLIANYAALSVMVAGTNTNALPAVPDEQAYPNTTISKGVTRYLGVLEVLDSLQHKLDNGATPVLRALGALHFATYLSFDHYYLYPNTYATWSPELERYDFNAHIGMFISGAQGSPVKNVTYVTYLPTNIFLNQDQIYEGKSIGSFDANGAAIIEKLTTETVMVNGEPRQKVTVKLKELAGSGFQERNARITLSFYTYDIERYQPGTSVPFPNNYTVIGDYSHLSRGYISGSTAEYRIMQDNGKSTPDGAKMTNQDNDTVDWVYLTDYQSIALPAVANITYSGVTKGILEEDGSVVRSAVRNVGKTWQYQLKVVSNKGKLQNVVVYDVLPEIGDASMGTNTARNSQYQAQLLDIDITNAVENGHTPVVYYSTVAQPGTNLTSGEWSTTPPENVSEVRALAFDFGESLFNGNNPTNTPDEANIIITVRSDADPLLDQKISYNNVYSTYDIIRTGVNQGNPVAAPKRDTLPVDVKLLASNVLIGSTLFADVDADGIMGTEEVGIEGRKVFLYQLNPETGEKDLVDQVLTDGNGNYLFAAPSDGTFYVGFEKTDKEKFSPRPETLPVAAEGEEEVVFSKIDPATIEGNLGLTSPVVVDVNDFLDPGRKILDMDAGVSIWHKVIYDANGGTGEQIDKQSPYLDGSTVTILGQGGITRPGYTFKGWNLAPDGSGTMYQAGDTFVITEDTTLYAIWVPEETPPVSSNPTVSEDPASEPISGVPSTSTPVSEVPPSSTLTSQTPSASAPAGGGNGQSGTAATGDATPLVWVLALFALAGCAIVVIVVRRKNASNK